MGKRLPSGRGKRGEVKSFILSYVMSEPKKPKYAGEIVEKVKTKYGFKQRRGMNYNLAGLIAKDFLARDGIGRYCLPDSWLTADYMFKIYREFSRPGDDLDKLLMTILEKHNENQEANKFAAQVMKFHAEVFHKWLSELPPKKGGGIKRKLILDDFVITGIWILMRENEIDAMNYFLKNLSEARSINEVRSKMRVFEKYKESLVLATDKAHERMIKEYGSEIMEMLKDATSNQKAVIGYAAYLISDLMMNRKKTFLSLPSS